MWVNGVVGNTQSLIPRFLLALLILIGAGALFYFSVAPLGRLRALNFLFLVSVPITSAYVLPFGGRTLKSFLLVSAAMPIVASPWILISGMQAGAGMTLLFNLWILCFACTALCLGLSKASTLWSDRSEIGVVVAGVVFLLLISGAWVSGSFKSASLDQVWMELNPLAALSDLIGIDWLRDGELYFSFPTEHPIHYPDWRYYSAGALTFGVILWCFGKFLSRSSEREI